MSETSSTALSLFPWQRQTWSQRLAPALSRGTSHHGMLIVGPEGIGKGRFASVLAAALICDDPVGEGLPCGRCRGCRLYAGGVHPDVTRIDLEAAERASLGVDQVRGLAQALELSSQYGGARVGLIDPADRMTVNAANSLLKTLEEPPRDAFLLLVASRPSRLPATIRSRCQTLRLSLPSPDEAGQWLAQQPEGERAGGLLAVAGGAPLAALTLAENGADSALQQLTEDLEAVARDKRSPVQAAEAWKDKGSAQRLVRWVEVLVMDLARAGEAGPDWLRIWDPVRIQGLLQALSSQQLQQFLVWLADTRRDLDQPLNDQLLAESLFIRWHRTTQSGN